MLPAPLFGADVLGTRRIKATSWNGYTANLEELARRGVDLSDIDRAVDLAAEAIRRSGAWPRARIRAWVRLTAFARGTVSVGIGGV